MHYFSHKAEMKNVFRPIENMMILILITHIYQYLVIAHPVIFYE